MPEVSTLGITDDMKGQNMPTAAEPKMNVVPHDE